MFWGTLTDSTLGASHSVLSSAIFAITHPNPFFCYHVAASRPSLSRCPLFGATVLLVSVLWQSLISCFFFFFLSSSPGVSSIASHALTSLAIYSPLLSSLFSFPCGLVQMSDQTEQHDPQRGAEFPLVHQSISNVPGCQVWTLKPSLRTWNANTVNCGYGRGQAVHKRTEKCSFEMQSVSKFQLESLTLFAAKWC